MVGERDCGGQRRVIEFPGLGFAFEFPPRWVRYLTSRATKCFRILDIIIYKVEMQPLDGHVWGHRVGLEGSVCCVF